MSSKKRPITVDDLYHIAYVEDPQISPDGAWIAYVHQTVDRFNNGYKNNIWLVATQGGDPIQLTRSDKDTSPRWSPDGKTLAFVSSRGQKPQIYLLPINGPGGEARQLTQQPRGAHSFAWSPDGQSIAFLSAASAEECATEDQGETPSEANDPLEARHMKERDEQTETERFDPRVIERIPYREGTSYRDGRYSHIYVISSTEKDAKARRLTHADTDHEAPSWSADGQFVFTTRDADPTRDEPRWHTNIFRISVEDGQATRMTQAGFADNAPVVSPDGEWVAYIRTPERPRASSIARLTIIPASGGEPRDLNLALDRSVESIHWTADSSAIVFTAGSEGNTEVYRAALNTGAVDKILAGTFEVTGLDIAADGSLAYALSTPANPSELFWQAAAEQPQQMTNLNAEFLESVIVQPVQELWFDSPSGTRIQGWYILPVGYEEGKTYPLAFNIHGGPYAMWGPSTRSMWHEWQFHAARGYAVFYANPRGSGGYGESFQKALHADWGNVAFDDLMAGVDTFISLGFVDTERMAVTGGSYGGYMTAWIVGHTGRFAAAVSQRGVYNLISFYGATDIPQFLVEQYDARPTEDPMRLWQHSPLAYADNITTPLLIIHSENDFRVPITDADQLFSYIKLRGGTVKYVRFPRDGHELSRSGEPAHRVSRLQHMINWFDQYCH